MGATVTTKAGQMGNSSTCDGCERLPAVGMVLGLGLDGHQVLSTEAAQPSLPPGHLWATLQ